MSQATILFGEVDRVAFTAAEDMSGGDVIKAGGNLAGVVVDDVLDTELGSAYIEGIFRVAKASATTFAEGAEVWFDASAGQAVNAGAALDGEDDFYIGRCFAAAVNGDTNVQVILNAAAALHLNDQVAYEFDCETGVDATAHVLLPAELNTTGWILEQAYSEVTEVFGGATEDQGIVTVEDTDGNDLCTLTPSNAGADAVGDIVVGYSLPAASTGAALKFIAAGKGIQALVTQACSGAGAAGKQKVHVLVRPRL